MSVAVNAQLRTQQWAFNTSIAKKATYGDATVSTHSHRYVKIWY